MATGTAAAPEAASSRADRRVGLAAVALVVAAAAVGLALNRSGRPVIAATAPLFADWLPHAGPGTPAALAVAAAVVAWGPALAVRLSWLRLLGAGYLTALAWTLSLAMIDGWRRGLAGRLTTVHEYLWEVPRVSDIPATLRTFTDHILDFQPDHWATHVSGHPPGALLVFVWLDRIGLGGGGWAALCCVAVGATVTVSVPTTLRALGREDAARAAVPFLALFPGAVWIGASADGMFAGVTAAGIALLAHGLARGGPAGRALVTGAGVLLGFGCYLSYGLVLMAPIAAVVALLVGGWRAVARTLPWTLLGAGAVVATFTLAGFWWWEGYQLLVVRYYQGDASRRAYGYWIWANLACVVLSAGPAAAAILRRAAVSLARRIRRALPSRRLDRAVVDAKVADRWEKPRARGGAADREAWQSRRRFTPAAALPLAAALAILAADLSGLSKAEVERIWLPFVVWLPAGAVLLPAASRRGWLAVQALTALAVNHLVLTVW